MWRCGQRSAGESGSGQNALIALHLRFCLNGDSLMWSVSAKHPNYYVYAFGTCAGMENAALLV